MLKKITIHGLLTAMLAILPVMALADDAPTPSADEQMSALVDMCAASADARAARHTDKPLYHRLGGYDRIMALSKEIIRLHSVNKDIVHTLDNVDREKLAKHLTDFVSAGTGGTAKYTGRDLPSSHEHLKLSKADFLSAGGDIIQAMKNLEYGQEEIDEFVCILVSLKDLVITR